MAKNEKKRNRQTVVYMTQHRKPKNKQHEPLLPPKKKTNKQKTRGYLRDSRRVSRSCSTCGTRRVAYVNSK